MEKCGICSKPASQLFETNTPGVFACFKCQPLIPEVSLGQDGSQDSNQSSIELDNVQEVVVTTERLQESEDAKFKDLICSICHKAFEKNAQLQNHIRYHLVERRFVCTYCDKAFSQSNNLRAHLRIHTNERPYKCTLCDKAFTQVTNLNNHFRLHTGERPFVCSEPGCNKAFAQVTNLNQHRKRHLNGKPVYYYACNLCGEHFEQRNHMFDHKREAHGIANRTSTGQKRNTVLLAPAHGCHICEKTFPTNSQLSEHVASHPSRDRGSDLDPLAFADDDSGSEYRKEPPIKCVFSGCDVRVWTAEEQNQHLLQTHQLRLSSNATSSRRGRPPKHENNRVGTKLAPPLSAQVQNKFMPNPKYVAIFSE